MTAISDHINRLLDIIVEEVSLVDRAANRRRFLIVKRSDMPEEMLSSTEDQPVDLNAVPEDTPAAGWDDFEDRTDTDTESTPHSSALAVAVAALERLTEAVETLASEDQAEGARLADLATELHAVASQIAEMAGGSDHAMTTGTDDALDSGSENGAVSELLGSIEGVLAQAKGLAISGPRRNRGAPNAVPAPAPTPASPEPSAALAKQLGELTEAMRGLNTTISGQQQRLARLEKHHGLPNSRPPGERSTRHEVDSSGWPLDLNKPYDRTSVDKSVSFHDA